MLSIGIVSQVTLLGMYQEILSRGSVSEISKLQHFVFFWNTTVDINMISILVALVLVVTIHTLLSKRDQNLFLYLCPLNFRCPLKGGLLQYPNGGNQCPPIVVPCQCSGLKVAVHQSINPIVLSPSPSSSTSSSWRTFQLALDPLGLLDFVLCVFGTQAV